jgi:inosose dehydratase
MANELSVAARVRAATSGIHFAMGGAIVGPLAPEHLELIARLGFPGIEPYRGLTSRYLDRPKELKSELDRLDLTLITCSNGGPGQSTDFIDPAKRQQTIADHVAFARDWLSVFGCRHFKINMGARPAAGTTDDQIRAIADTVNELARQTADLGILLSPHPHIWGPIERPHEVRRLLELTDPRYVGLIVDTAQINLGGGDPLELIDVYYDRIPAIHFKDSRAEYHGHTGPTPTQEQHRQAILYQDLGSGGVEHVAIWQLLLKRGYTGWITLDLDPPRPSEGEGTPEDKMRINRRYLTDTLKVANL